MTRSRILFCSPTPVTPRMGASKVYLEAAEAFGRIGWEVTLVGPAQYAGEAADDWRARPLRLREYLRREAKNFDVIEYEHNALPYPRTDFPTAVLMVARSVLLTHTVAAADIPPRPTLRSRVGRRFKGWWERWEWRTRLLAANATLQSADVVNVANTDERDALLHAGCPAAKLLVQPFGLFPERLAAFRPTADELPAVPRIAFVGTFDPRKGMGEWPALADAVAKAQPTACFRLVGTAGMVPSADAVRYYFPRAFRGRVEVIPRFDPAELPGLLADCIAGAFPSHCEGFPFGVLEMLAAGLPVVAYRAPGPPMMLGAENLVPKGDGRALGRRLAALLSDPDALRLARRAARRIAESFQWEEIAARTAEIYLRVRGTVRAGGPQ